jgi:membrane protease YdiL (CAAX protease family)
MPAILPGLTLVVIVDVLAVLGVLQRFAFIQSGWMVVIAVTPWLTLLMLRRPASALGYHRQRAAANFGWGVLFGVVWRGLSMTLNLWLIGREVLFGVTLGGFFSALVLVPLVEESFFRGYLGRALSARFGSVQGIVMQAMLFGFLPTHWGQGWIAMVSILGFGLLAGWLVQRTGSLWTAWGAHASANFIPLILLLQR